MSPEKSRKRSRGQVYKWGNGWMVRVPNGRALDGSRKYISRTVHGTKKDAERELTRLLRERDTGILVEPSRQTVGEFLQSWLETTAKARLREVTLRSYRAWLGRTILKADLAARRLSGLTGGDVQAFLNGMVEQGYSPRSVEYVRAILRSALEQAVLTNVLPRNPAAGKAITLPRKHQREMRALSPEEARRFNAAAADDPWHALWVLLLTTGLRPGEACGLNWADLQGHRLSVQRTLVWRYKGEWTLTEPKTSKARRSHKLPEIAVKALLDHERKQKEQMLAAGPDYSRQGFIFANAVGQPIDIRALVRPHFNKILTRAGLPRMRLYDLRHSAATVLAANGVPIKVISEMLGHSSPLLTLSTYSHVLEEMQTQAAATMDAVFATG